MKKIMALVGIVAVLAIVISVIVNRRSTADYVTLTSWESGEVLTAADLNTNFTNINASLDSLDQGFPDTFYLNWTNAFGVSLGSNDSLIVTIIDDAPFGDGQGVYIQNDYGVEEQVKLVIDSRLPHDIAMLDSIVLPIWTEETDKTDWVTIAVHEDSTHHAWKGVATATTDSATSSTARTVLDKGTTTSIKGGKFRFELTIETESDSMLFGRPKCFVSNPAP